jgi:hypothetical protein
MVGTNRCDSLLYTVLQQCCMSSTVYHDNACHVTCDCCTTAPTRRGDPALAYTSTTFRAVGSQHLVMTIPDLVVGAVVSADPECWGIHFIIWFDCGDDGGQYVLMCSPQFPFILTLIMDEFGLPVLSFRTLTHSNQRISEEFRGVIRGHDGGQQFVRMKAKQNKTPENRQDTGKIGH